MAAAAALTAPIEEAQKQEIPAYLVKEVLDGKPLYYKGYKEVLNNNKTLEDIMGSSSLQAEIISCILRFLYKNVDETKYRVYTNEIGSHISHKNNISHDIAIFDKTILTPDKINERYTEVPAKVIIEVDVRIEAEQFPEWEYVTKKNETVFAFGTEKAIWVLSKAQKVIVAQPGQDWLIIDWNKDIELFDGHFFNIGTYLQSEGIQLQVTDI